MEDAPQPIGRALLERVRNGDEAASDELVERLYPLVWMRVCRYVRRTADRDDVVQDVFAKLFLKIGQYTGPQPFEHWVSRLAATTCYDYLRRCKARPLVSYSDLSEPEAMVLEQGLRGSRGAGELEIHRELLDGLLDKLLATLKPNEQIVIRLLDLQELSIREAVEETGWSPSKVKTLAMRARRKLSAQLRRLEGRHES